MASSSARDLPHVPELEDTYDLVRELGRGGSAVVYLARERELGRDVAIKLIRPAAGADEEALARLLREARTVGKLQHPNIVMLLGTRRLSGGGLALVLQFVPGMTLKEHIRERGPLPTAEAERILADLGRALSYAHRHRIVHRDVKPENIYLDEEAGIARLADFGIARPWDSDSGLTLPGTAIGTPSYMSPEQVEGGRMDGRSDVYSLGLVAWEMLTGDQPWAGESLYETIYKQKNEELPPIQSFREDVPASLRSAVERALRKDPNERWASADAFMDALRAPVVTPPAAALTPDAVQSSGEDGHVEDDAAAEEEEVATGSGAGLGALFGLVLLGAIGAGALTGPSQEWIQASLSQWFPTEEAQVVSDPTNPVGPSAGDTPRSGAPEDSPDLPRLAAEDSSPTPDGDNPGQPLGREEAPDGLDSADVVGTLPEPVPEAPTASQSPASTGPGIRVSPLTVRVAVATGGTHTCRLAADGEITCWGGNRRGQLGDEGGDRRLEPGGSVPGGPFARLTGGLDHVCGLDIGGTAHCWGANDRGQLGDGSTTSRARPDPVTGAPAMIRISAGASHTCGETGRGEVFCWGSNEEGQLGDGTSESRYAPVRVEAATPLTGVTAGWRHTCALDERGRAYCWGSNASGQLGRSTQDPFTASIPISGTQLFRELSAGNAHTCGLSWDGEAYCWGSNASGQLGDGTLQDRRIPTPVASGSVFVSITAGAVHTCGLVSSGTAFCWGRNLFGQVGDGTSADRTEPVEVTGSAGFEELHAFGSHTCGRTLEGEIHCWGYNGEGQLGDGSRRDRNVPARIGAGALP